MVNKRDKTGRTLSIVLSIIAIVVTLFSGVLQSPVLATILQDKPVAEISFGNAQNFSNNVLFSDGSYYFTDITGINLGKTVANPQVIVMANGAIISFDKSNWNKQQTTNLLINPDHKSSFYQLYVYPNPNSTSFSISFLSTPPQLFKIQDVYYVNPITLTYHFTDGKWQSTP